MANYTNIENLLKTAREIAQRYSSSCLASVHIIKAIEDAPKADVVEVCRCKDCESYNGHRFCLYHADPVLDDDYCSYGIRKEGADNG